MADEFNEWIDDYSEPKENKTKEIDERRALYEQYEVKSERLVRVAETAKEEIMVLHKEYGIEIDEDNWPRIYYINAKDMTNVGFPPGKLGAYEATTNSVVIAVQEKQEDEYKSVIGIYHELLHFVGMDEGTKKVGLESYGKEGSLIEESFVHYFALRLANRSDDSTVMEARRSFGAKLARERSLLGIFNKNPKSLDQLVVGYLENWNEISKRKSVVNQGVEVVKCLIELATRKNISESDFLGSALSGRIKGGEKNFSVVLARILADKPKVWSDLLSSKHEEDEMNRTVVLLQEMVRQR